MQARTKKMTLTQLTFIVAVNMMGSGIIMLPTNMAKVGAISLLSWVVTAVGSLAIAYVAVAISAVGYLTTFIPWLASTPTATCVGVIALLWLTTIANFGGPGL